jgi:Na+-transporting NADH:ubiquinone oxidoreductase subunit NqrA
MISSSIYVCSFFFSDQAFLGRLGRIIILLDTGYKTFFFFIFFCPGRQRYSFFNTTSGAIG